MCKVDLFIFRIKQVMTSVCKAYPIILYLRDVDMILFRSQKLYRLFQKMLQRFSGPVLILGSRITHQDSNDGSLCFFICSMYPSYLIVLTNSLWLLNCLSHGLSVFQERKSAGKDTMKLESRAEPSKVCF